MSSIFTHTVIPLAIVALLGGCDPDGDALALACAEYHDPEKPPASPAEAGITLTYTSGLAVDHSATEFVLAGGGRTRARLCDPAHSGRRGRRDQTRTIHPPT